MKTAFFSMVFILERGGYVTSMFTKRMKTFLYVAGPIIILLTIFVWVLSFFEEKEPEVIVYPAGVLSDSLFDSQNTSYVETSAYSSTYEFTNIPYTIDTVAVNGAVVDSGCIFPYGPVTFGDSAGMVYYYYAVVPKTEKMSTYVVEQLSQALDFGVSPVDCTIEVCVADQGYINGFDAEYQIYHLNVPTGREYQNLYVLAYRLKVNDDDEIKDDNDIIVSVATTTLSNSALQGCASLLTADLMTVQYDSIKARDLLQEVSNETGTEETESETDVSGSEENSSEEKQQEESRENIQEENTEQSSSENNETTMGILLNQDYSNLTIVVSWTEPSETPTISIETPTASKVFSPDSMEAGKAYFNIGEIKKGVYIARIGNWESCGTFTSELIEQQGEGE